MRENRGNQKNTQAGGRGNSGKNKGHWDLTLKRKEPT